MSATFSSRLATTKLYLETRLWVWPIVSVVVLLALGIWARTQIERPLKARLNSELTTVLNADVAALRLWLSHQLEKTEIVTNDDAIRRICAAIVASAKAQPEETATALLKAPDHEQLGLLIATHLGRHFYNGFVLFDMSARVIASDTPELVGKTPYDVTSPWLALAIGGKPSISPPFKSLVLLRDSKGRMRSGIPTMFFLAPVRNEANEQIATIAVRTQPESDFSNILRIARVGNTGETYAVDRNGDMISQSRFDEDLKRVGLLTDNEDSISTLNLEVRDPGVNMMLGERPSVRRSQQPLTSMAAELTQGKSGSNVDGYRGYRGVPVVGAWTWLDEFGFGVATEVDSAEAFQPVRFVQRVFWGLYAMLALAAAAIFVSTIVNARLERAMRKAVLDAKRLGQYSLDEKIGAGAMGVVYRARHDMLHRPTAIKLLNVDTTSPASIQRFEREVKTTSQLNHPNTVTIFDYGRTPEGVFYYAMEYLEGVTLDQLVKRFGPVPEGRTIYILKQVCGSLAEAHAAGLIHRDIKPENIMLTTRGGVCDVVKVLDFGVVKARDAATAAALTAADSMIGTPNYMSPEAINTPDSIDARSDLYAVGAVGYFLLTGVPVFTGSSLTEIFQSHIHERPTAPSARTGKQFDTVLENVLLRCLAKSADERPVSASALRGLLNECESTTRWNETMAATWWRHYLPGFLGPMKDDDSGIVVAPTAVMSQDAMLE